MAMEAARHAEERIAAGQHIIRFDVGQPHFGAPPAALAAAAAAAAAGPLGYTDARGSPALRAGIADLYRRRHGIAVDPERIVVTTGASGAFILIFLALFGDGDRVALAAPGYPPYRHILTALGMRPAIAPAAEADRLQLTPDALRTLAQREKLAGALIASPANPTGVVLSAAELKALADAARDLNIPLISDEIYHGLTYEGPAETALAVDPEAIIVSSFSKYWAMTGWRVGWLIVPPDLAKAIERLAQNLFICAPAPAQAAALAALEAEELCEARRAVYGANRAMVAAALPRLGLRAAATPDGAFYFLLDVSGVAGDSAEFCRRALEAGVALTPGFDFDAERGGRWARLAYPIVSGDVEEGLDRMARLLA